MHVLFGNFGAFAMHESHRNDPSVPQFTQAIGMTKSTAAFKARETFFIIGVLILCELEIGSTPVFVYFHGTLLEDRMEVEFGHVIKLSDSATRVCTPFQFTDINVPNVEFVQEFACFFDFPCRVEVVDRVPSTLHLPPIVVPLLRLVPIPTENRRVARYRSRRG